MNNIERSICLHCKFNRTCRDRIKKVYCNKVKTIIAQRRIERSNESYDREKEQEFREFFNSDIFDKHSVGKDITFKEFLENEIWFEKH